MADEKKPESAATTEKASTSVEEATRAAAEARRSEVERNAAAVATATETALKAERQRQLEIRNLVVKRAKLGEDLADKLIAEGATVDDVRKAVLEHLAADDEKTPTNQHTRFGAGEDATDKFIRGASAWLFERAGVADTLRQAQKADEKGRFKDVAFDPGEFRGLSLTELARESLERRGVKTRGMGRMDMIGLAFTHRGAYQTTSDFAVLFENVMHKTLLGAYAIQADTWSRFCKIDTVSDFRASNRFRTGSLSVLDAKNEHGEFKNKIVPDGAKSSISVATKGNIIALSRETIINDDMGALADMAQKLGRAAKLTIETDVYALLNDGSGLGPTLADSSPFFDDTLRSNVNTTGAALSAAALGADAMVLAEQMDQDGNEYLDLQPAVLLVNSSKLMTAKTLNTATYDPAGTAGTLLPNNAQGMFRDVVGSPRLTDKDRRYIFADPSIAAAIVVAFLEGQGQAPVLDSENGWRVDGVEWKVRLDFKAQIFDPKGAVTNAGK